VNLIFLKKKLKNGLLISVPVIPTDKPILPIGLSVLVDFNHYRPTSFSTGLSVIPIGRPVY
jgi:hypothetical protein